MTVVVIAAEACYVVLWKPSVSRRTDGPCADAAEPLAWMHVGGHMLKRCPPHVEVLPVMTECRFERLIAEHVDCMHIRHYWLRHTRLASGSRQDVPMAFAALFCKLGAI